MKTKLKIGLILLVILGSLCNIVGAADVCKEYTTDVSNYILAVDCYLRADNLTEAKKYAQKWLDEVRGNVAGGPVDFYAKAITKGDKSYLDEAERIAPDDPQFKEMINTARVKVFSEAKQPKPEDTGTNLSIIVLTLVVGIVIGLVIGQFMKRRSEK